MSNMAIGGLCTGENINDDSVSHNQNDDMDTIINMLHAVISKINAFGVRCCTAENKLKSALNRSDELDKKCVTLQLEMNNLKSQKCNKCPKLKKYILTHKKKSNTVEMQLKSIAKILNAQNSDNFSVAQTLASQMLTENVTLSEKRSRNNEISDTESTDLEEIQVSQKLQLNDSSEMCTSIKMTPKKLKVGNERSLSPIIYKKNIKHKYPHSSPKKENINISGKNTSLISMPININEVSVKQKDILQEVSLLKDNISSNDVKNESLLTDTKEPKIWNLKKSRDISASNNQKLKQMTLSVTVGNKQDISKIPDFNGGVQKSNNNLNTCNFDETIFFPEASSTNIEFENKTDKEEELVKGKKYGDTTLIKDTSVIKRNLSSPPYKYRRDTVRKKQDRLQLPGQDCQNCYKFYEQKAGELTSTQLREYMNKCSKHRDKYAIRTSTPPDFWNPIFNDTDD